MHPKFKSLIVKKSFFMMTALVISGHNGIAIGQSIDNEAALALAKRSDCFKCHTVDKKKDGPAYREVAKKWRGKSDAESKLYTHVTTSPKVKIDGEEEIHGVVKSKDDAEIKNLLRYILSLPDL